MREKIERENEEARDYFYLLLLLRKLAEWQGLAEQCRSNFGSSTAEGELERKARNYDPREGAQDETVDNSLYHIDR